MSDIQKLRTKGIELQEFSFKNFMKEAKDMGYIVGRTPFTTLKKIYSADRSIRRLKRNMVWILQFLRVISPNLNTRSKRMYDMQQLLSSLYGDEHKTLIRKIMQLSPKEYETIGEQAKKARQEKLKNITLFKKSSLLKIIQDLDRNDSIDRIILLQLCTGRRLIEVLKVCDMPKLEDNKLVFNQLAKSNGTDFKVPYFHLEYPEIISIWEKLRAKIKHVFIGKNNAEISLCFNALVNYRVKELCGDINVSSHFLRKLYVAWGLTLKPKRVAAVVYVNSILGHAEGFLDSATNYMTVQIDSTETDFGDKKVKDIRDNPTYIRMAECCKQLHRDGKKRTYRNLKACGFSSGSIKKYRDLIFL
jgi:hypothetical protein